MTILPRPIPPTTIFSGPVLGSKIPSELAGTATGAGCCATTVDAVVTAGADVAGVVDVLLFITTFAVAEAFAVAVLGVVLGLGLGVGVGEWLGRGVLQYLPL